jgi:hypothetical protein
MAEFAIAAAVAVVAGYVRGRVEASPLSPSGIVVRVADGIVCGCLSMGIITVLKQAEWVPVNDTTALAGISAALGLIGTNAISRILTNLAQRKTGTEERK